MEIGFGVEYGCATHGTKFGCYKEPGRKNRTWGPAPTPPGQAQLTNRPKNGAHGAQGRKRGPEGGDANAPSKTPAWAGPRLPCPLSPR